LEIREEIQDDITIYWLNGRLDTNTSPELEIRLFFGWITKHGD
jgi:hypothetical protein